MGVSFANAVKSFIFIEHFSNKAVQSAVYDKNTIQLAKKKGHYVDKIKKGKEKLLSWLEFMEFSEKERNLLTHKKIDFVWKPIPATLNNNKKEIHNS